MAFERRTDMNPDIRDETRIARNLNLMGNCDHEGGRFRKVSIMGQVRFRKDLRCLSFSCMGKAWMEGAFRSAKTSVMGELAMEGPAEGGRLSVMGKVIAEQSLSALRLDAMGELTVRGKLEAEEVKLLGRLNVEGDCNVDRFTSYGDFDISGLLSVDDLRVTPGNRCHAEEIGGARIEVRRHFWRHGMWEFFRFLSGFFHERRLEARTIEGDEVILEDVTADLVRGTRVRIGRGCRIRRVEYGELCHIHPKAEVGESVQS
jgi:cytoskeletal protein CcmA (bactofilin family)